jgi:hypothetical protein
MRIISGLIRIITGLAIMGFAGFIYFTNQEQLSGSKETTVSIFGQSITTTPENIIIGLGVAGVIGLLIEMLGVWTLVRKPSAPSSAP